MSSSNFYLEREMRLYKNGSFQPMNDLLVLEVPLQVVLNNVNQVIMACSPEGFEELAVGFLISEGILSRTDVIQSIDVEEQTVYIKTNRPLGEVKVQQSVFINTCSGRGLGQEPLVSASYDRNYTFNPANLLELIRKLDETSYTFQRTGGVHSAALGGGTDLILRYEDIGRHNAVDKVLGQSYLKQIPLYDKCLVLSGRIAGEIVIKSIRHGIPLILSRSAPTFRAVELADKAGLTIIGFARGEKFNAYCHWDRIA